ncbi:uncharacterized protein LOC126624239 [Malus sylvestris]|uniref:uncharacterized protein LOC126624239 n=1 Tax=Malus sylvestris TaxID=3752 RepID=UPI0021ACD0CC|nr:uncharacterized protein LOC126624239 [Malus sylvestris]
MASTILFPLALKSGGFPLEASDYSAIFGLPWTLLHFKLLFGLGIRGFQSKNGPRAFFSFCCTILLMLLLCIENSERKGENNQQSSQAWLLDTLFAVPSLIKTIVDSWLQRVFPFFFCLPLLLQVMPIYRHPGKALGFVTWGNLEAMNSCHFYLTSPTTCAVFFHVLQRDRRFLCCTFFLPLL